MQQQKSRRSRALRRVMVGAMVVGLAVVAGADSITVKKVVLVQPDQDLQSDPIETVNANGKLEVLERKNGFVKVKTPSGKIGYVSQDDLPSNVNVGGMTGPLGPSHMSTSAASKGLQDDAEHYVKSRHVNKEPVETMMAWGDAVVKKDLNDFDKEGHVGRVKHR